MRRELGARLGSSGVFEGGLDQISRRDGLVFAEFQVAWLGQTGAMVIGKVYAKVGTSRDPTLQVWRHEQGPTGSSSHLPFAYGVWRGFLRAPVLAGAERFEGVGEVGRIGRFAANACAVEVLKANDEGVQGLAGNERALGCAGAAVEGVA